MPCSYSMTDKHVTYLGLGSNIGDKEANIRTALDRIQESVGDVVRQSALYVSEPWGFESDNLFVNAVACVHTTLTPRQLLAATQRIERKMGRKKKSSKGVYHDRIIDIDILLYDDLHLSAPDLVIPHPLMWQREFVMTPLREIIDQPDWLAAMKR